MVNINKKATIVIGVIIGTLIIFNIVLTPKNYLEYVFYNLNKGNYSVVNYLLEDDKNNITKMYKFTEKNGFNKPLKFIKKEDNSYCVMLKSYLLNKEQDDYGSIIGVYTMDLNISISHSFLSFPKIKKVNVTYEKLDVPNAFNMVVQKNLCTNENRNSFLEIINK